jgi:hypothetical protein
LERRDSKVVGVFDELEVLFSSSEDEIGNLTKPLWPCTCSILSTARRISRCTESCAMADAASRSAPMKGSTEFEAAKNAFAALGLSDPLCEACALNGYKAPTEIQAGAIPPALEGKDIIGLAETVRQKGTDTHSEKEKRKKEKKEMRKTQLFGCVAEPAGCMAVLLWALRV